MLRAPAHRHLLPALGILLSLLVWKLASVLAATPSVFPGPFLSFFAAADLIASGYLTDLGATILRATGSWLLALSLGVPVGLVLGLSTAARDLTRGVLAFFRSLPAFMLVTIPLALGVGGEASRIAIITLASLAIVVDECAESLATISQDRIDLVHAYRGGFWFVLTRVLVFEALGRAVVPAARTTIGISFIVAIVCETLLIPSHGVGARLLTSLSGLETASVYGFLLLTGVAGMLLNSGVYYLARRVIFWT